MRAAVRATFATVVVVTFLVLLSYAPAVLAVLVLALLFVVLRTTS